MTGWYRVGAAADPAALLDRAIAFTLGAVHAVTPDRLSGPTPCAQWDLRALLIHVADSLEALGDGLGTGRMEIDPPGPARPQGPAPVSAPIVTPEHGLPGPASAPSPGSAVPLTAGTVPPADDPVACLRGQAARLRGVWAAGVGRRPVRIADSALDPRIVLGVGAVEIAVHGWDICRACGLRSPIPPALAVELAGVCALVVTPETRYPAFAAPVAVPGRSCPSDHLVAFLGRDPATTSDPS
jgi:uncharacterized protein (TIGR03086 family)